MVKKEDIERFYSDLEALWLRFPVVAISEATGYSKGQVSDYLNRKKTPSAKFIQEFYKTVGSSINVPRDTPIADKAKAYDALFSVLIADYAAWKGQQTGENPEVITRKIYKAAEDVQRLNG